MLLMKTHKHKWVMVGKDEGSGDDNAYAYRCECGAVDVLTLQAPVKP